MYATDTTSTTTETPPVIDVFLPKPRTVIAVVVVVVAAIIVVVPCVVFFKAIGFSPLAGTSPPFGGILIGLVVGSFAALVVWGVRKWREEPTIARARRVVASAERQELPCAVERFCEQFPIETVLPTRSICSALAGFGKVGLIFRSYLSAQYPSIEPIAVPFEPVPLDQSNGLFVGLEANTPASDAPSVRGESWRTKTGVARRIEFFGGRWLFVMLGVFVVLDGLVHWMQGTLLSPTFWMLLSFLLMILVGIGGVGAWRHNKQWLLVPGGLAVRKTARKAASKWDVRLYSRRSSVLFVRQTTKRHWLVCVAEDAASDHVVVTRAEVEMLLRAWLSPLTPPPVQQLSDLE